MGCRKVSLLFNNTIQYNIKKNGEYTYYYNLTSKFESKAYNERTSYCIEHATKGKMNDYYMFWCLAEAPLEDKFTLTLWTKILSVVCLLITVVVYFILGEHRNTFGKILINYSFAMCSLMILLTIVHLTRRSSRIECKIKGKQIIIMLESFSCLEYQSHVRDKTKYHMFIMIHIGHLISRSSKSRTWEKNLKFPFDCDNTDKNVTV